MSEPYRPKLCLDCIYRDTAARRHDDPFTSAPADIDYCTHGAEFIVHNRYDIVDKKEIRDPRCPLLGK